MVRDNLDGTTVEPSQNQAPTRNQGGTQHLPAEHIDHQNQLLEIENDFVQLNKPDPEKEKQDPEEQNQNPVQQNPEVVEQDQVCQVNQTRPPEPTSSEPRLQPWWYQWSTNTGARPGISHQDYRNSTPLQEHILTLPWPRVDEPCPDPRTQFWTFSSLQDCDPCPLTLSWHTTPPTHLRTFSSLQECVLVQQTHRQLVHSGFYWGAMDMEEAHHILLQTPPGTFLIRDSGQPDVFFTLSYHGDEGPTSVRVFLDNQKFHLHGSKKMFDSLFSMLRFYMNTTLRRLRQAWHRDRPMTLQQLCRRRVIDVFGADRIDSLPGLNSVVTQYLHNYPYNI
ncbi:hypothetical protein UPYG_G00058310 [Umbra pygmaea]|uniref:Suppressor of cytokine signaling 1-like n=1 Tax=Umbra pygmaea TaxID=75934 RepID=A0ABD0XNT6_UMBPY